MITDLTICKTAGVLIDKDGDLGKLLYFRDEERDPTDERGCSAN